MYEEYKRLVSEYQQMLKDPSKLEDAKNLKLKIDECFNKDRLNIASSYLQEYLMVKIEPQVLENGTSRMKTAQEITDECNNIREEIGRKVQAQMLARNHQPTFLSFVNVVQDELIRKITPEKVESELEILDDDTTTTTSSAAPQDNNTSNPNSNLLLVVGIIVIAFIFIMIFPFPNPVKPHESNNSNNEEVKQPENNKENNEKDPSKPTKYYTVSVFDDYTLAIPNNVSFSYNQNNNSIILQDSTLKTKALIIQTKFNQLEFNNYIAELKAEKVDIIKEFSENQQYGNTIYTVVTVEIDGETIIFAYATFSNEILEIVISNKLNNVNESKEFLITISDILSKIKKN